MTGVAITALKAYQRTLFSEMLLDALVGIAVVFLTEAFIQLSGTFPTFYVCFEFSHSEDFHFLKTSTSMTNFNSVNYILKDFRLNISECIWILTLAEEANDSVPLLCNCAVISSQTAIADNFGTVSALLRVYGY